MPAARIAICHQVVVTRDAIGTDIVGMYDLFARMGCRPEYLAEHCELGPGRTVRLHLPPDALNDYDLTIYHHSISWERGARLIEHCRRPLVLRYHNVTPQEFFLPYAPRLAASCRRGSQQTRGLIAQRPDALWIADSPFNWSDLVALGADPARVTVVPPFNSISRFHGQRPVARYDNGARSVLLVGRLAPNKGHAAALGIVDAYRLAYGSDVTLVFVGKRDPALASYYADLADLVEALGIGAHVTFVPDASDTTLTDLFLSSHAYLCTSGHEGFCLPIVEAQAAGLPVVAFDTSAVRDTLGPQQLVGPPASEPVGYAYYARLLHHVLADGALRARLVAQGYRNVLTRFTREAIENALVDSLWPVLGRA